MPQDQQQSLLARLTPGILVAATGVGAGDLLTASFAGAQTGVLLLWTVVVGALFKWGLNEGIARWQMGTETTLLEGWTSRLGGWIRWIFLIYFLFWSLMVGGALISACGVAGDGLLSLGDHDTSRVIWGILHSLIGLAIVWIGGFKFFEKIMMICIAAMFVGVLLTAALLPHDWGSVMSGLLVPSLPSGSLPLVLGVMGGVGGTVTLLSYGYWIRARKRTGWEGLKASRLDLGVAYVATALFGIAMILIGSHIKLESQGAKVGLLLAAQLGQVLGPVGKYLFLIGFWGAVFSSLLGVWQSAPYLFADFLYAKNKAVPDDLTTTKPYRLYLIAIAVVPTLLLWFSVKQVQIAYAVLGALFMPLLALTLLLMNNRTDWVGSRFRNTFFLNAILIVTLVLFLYIGGRQIVELLP
ncbi:MAG: Nramp family divalent metal transporter [Candidatus Kapaibacterium sp.]